jgi:hypothetical protein
MFGPVSGMEMTIHARRGRSYYWRWFVITVLVVQLLGFAVQYRSTVESSALDHGYIWSNLTHRMVTSYLRWLAVQQFLLIVLATPAVTAGAITEEKVRGTLLDLLNTDLSSWQIVIGKLVGRCYEVILLLGVTLPAMSFFAVWGGLTVWSLVLHALSWIGPIVAIASLSLLLSVWCRQTRDAVIGVYAIGALSYGLWCLMEGLADLWPLAAGLRRVAGYYTPDYVLETGFAGDGLATAAERLVITWIAWGVFGWPCLVVAVWRLRPAYWRQLERVPRQGILVWLRPDRPPVSDEPLLWKERHVHGLAPLAILRRIPRWLAMTSVSVLTATGFVVLLGWNSGRAPGWILRRLLAGDLSALTTTISPDGLSQAFLWVGIVAAVCGSLLVGVRGAHAISSEREQRTWEALLVTPLEVRHLVRHKLWGILGAAMPYFVAAFLPLGVLATILGPPSAWVVTLIGLMIVGPFVVLGRRCLDSWAFYWVLVVAVSTGMVLSLLVAASNLFLVGLMSLAGMLAMLYMGAAGIWCSARSTSSWRSLVATVGLGYVGGFVLWLLTTPITVLVGLIIFGIFRALSNADAVFGTQAAQAFQGFVGPSAVWVIGTIASAIVLAGVFLAVPRWLIASAEQFMATRDRVRHWQPWESPRPIASYRRYRQLKHPVTR